MLFKEERLGMFIHFGLYSCRGWHEQEMWRCGVSKAEYEKTAREFCPNPGCAEKWVLAAKEAGMQYICFTTKHHDGFCLWNTAHTEYNVMNTPYGRDLLAELAEACEKHGLLLELYYSQPDWHYPHALNLGGDHQLPVPNPGDTPDEEKYKQYIRLQMKELLTNYGKISAIFWDIPPAGRDPSINEYVRSLQPGILINDRGYDKGDYSTPERCVPEGAFQRRTEACQSVGAESWGYRSNEDYFTSAHLVDSIDKILSKGGNYLINVGPDEKGRIPEEAALRLKRIGRFYRSARESYLGCRTLKGTRFPMTASEDALYVHLPAGFPQTGVNLRPLQELPLDACILGREEKLYAEVVKMPSEFFHSPEILPHLHIGGLPSEEMGGYPMILRLRFQNLEKICDQLETSSSEWKGRIL